MFRYRIRHQQQTRQRLFSIVPWLQAPIFQRKKFHISLTVLQMKHSARFFLSQKEHFASRGKCSKQQRFFRTCLVVFTVFCARGQPSYKIHNSRPIFLIYSFRPTGDQTRSSSKKESLQDLFFVQPISSASSR